MWWLNHNYNSNNHCTHIIIDNYYLSVYLWLFILYICNAAIGGSRISRGGGGHLVRGRQLPMHLFKKKLYVKIEESGPLGPARDGCAPLDLPKTAIS